MLAAAAAACLLKGLLAPQGLAVGDALDETKSERGGGLHVRPFDPEGDVTIPWMLSAGTPIGREGSFSLSTGAAKRAAVCRGRFSLMPAGWLIVGPIASSLVLLLLSKLAWDDDGGLSRC